MSIGDAGRLRWWEYPLAIGVMLMLVGGGIHFSITSKRRDLVDG